ncbi:MAG: 4-(cytidine 5'-diphospho)-2-C-methyl-D-erythritol kinase [Clostridia bacterium]|nr:4-(cytidine 5'-diphospho)-2-C-methyl-D-erythritol kinase [Clostridia bacterium]
MKKTYKAHAKINLSLDVLRKRPDNYHDLKSVMQSMSLHDEITLETDTENGIEISTNRTFLATNEKNIAYKAADLFYTETGLSKNVHIHIKKNIPVGAGLGGGSSDAAAVLYGLNELYGDPLGRDKLLALGLACGADVPFCQTGGTCLAEGLGEILTPLSPIPECIILIAKPQMSISTKSVFEAIDTKAIQMHPNTDGIIDSLNSNNLSGIAVRVYNVFEDYVKPRYKELDKIKGVMLDCGALGSAMSGTGSAVFGIFTDEKAARKAANKLKRNKLQTFITYPVQQIFAE